MALIRITPQPPRRQPAWLLLLPRRELPALRPNEWAEILTIDPTPRKPGVQAITAAAGGLFIFGLFFSTCVVIIQPFLLTVYATNYPNLATVSFTSITLAVIGLTLAVLPFFIFLLRSFTHQATNLGMILAGIALLGVVGGFFFLLFREIVIWTLSPAGLDRFIQAWLDFFQMFS